jgi:hypothetical protein
VWSLNRLRSSRIALTDKQLENMLAVTREMDTLTATAAEDAKPDPTATDCRAHRQGKRFARFDEYSNVFDNIRLVLGGNRSPDQEIRRPGCGHQIAIARSRLTKNVRQGEKGSAPPKWMKRLKSPPPPAIGTRAISMSSSNTIQLAEFGSGEQD